MRKALLILALSFAFGLEGQNTSTIKFIIDPGHDYKVKVDNDTIWNSHYVTVSPGIHQYQIWAPGYVPVDTNLTTMANDTLEVFRRLEKTEEYASFLAEHDAIVSGINKKQGASLLLTSVGLVYSTVQYVKMRKEYGRLEDQVNVYYDSEVTAITDRARVEHKSYVDNFYSRRNTFRTAVVITGIGAVMTYVVFKKTRKIRLPVYDDNYQFEFESLGLLQIPGGGPQDLTPGITLTMTL